MKEYFKKTAISNSLLKRVGFFFQEKMIDRFSYEEEEKETESMFLGSQIHKAIETNGNSIGNLKVLDTECFEVLDDKEKKFFSPNKIKILKSENPFDTYLELYDNATTRQALKGDEKSVKKIEDEVADIMFKGSPYLNSRLGISNEDIILNEYKLVDGDKETYISDPQGFKAKVEACYNGVVTSAEHEQVVARDLFEECIEHFELEYYTELRGYKVKGMFDRVIILPEQNRAVLIDYKTYHRSTTIEKSIIKYNYCHQLSWYLKLFEMWMKENGYTGYSVETYIVGISTESAKVTVVPLSIKALSAGQYGGYLKTALHTLYNDNEEYDLFLSEADVEWLRFNNFWSDTKNNQFKRLGWMEHFDIGVEAGIFDEFKV